MIASQLLLFTVIAMNIIESLYLLLWLMFVVILTTVKVDKQYRITLPKAIREQLQLTTDSELIFFTVAEWKERVCFRKA
jgi:AbrB family looped-hinge helix DNA binding protein